MWGWIYILKLKPWSFAPQSTADVCQTKWQSAQWGRPEGVRCAQQSWKSKLQSFLLIHLILHWLLFDFSWKTTTDTRITLELLYSCSQNASFEVMRKSVIGLAVTNSYSTHCSYRQASHLIHALKTHLEKHKRCFASHGTLFVRLKRR